jgi:hypothetical protein
MAALELSAAELSTAATAKAMSNPDMRRPIENTAHRFAALAAKFEAAGTASTATHSGATRAQGRS